MRTEDFKSRFLNPSIDEALYVRGKNGQVSQWWLACIDMHICSLVRKVQFLDWLMRCLRSMPTYLSFVYLFILFILVRFNVFRIALV